jgi:hypothetical protein
MELCVEGKLNEKRETVSKPALYRPAIIFPRKCALPAGPSFFYAKERSKERQRQKKLPVRMYWPGGRFCRGVHLLSFRTSVVPGFRVLTFCFISQVFTYRYLLVALFSLPIWL